MSRQTLNVRAWLSVGREAAGHVLPALVHDVISRAYMGVRGYTLGSLICCQPLLLLSAGNRGLLICTYQSHDTAKPLHSQPPVSYATTPDTALGSGEGSPNTQKRRHNSVKSRASVSVSGEGRQSPSGSSMAGATYVQCWARKTGKLNMIVFANVITFFNFIVFKL